MSQTKHAKQATILERINRERRQHPKGNLKQYFMLRFLWSTHHHFVKVKLCIPSIRTGVLKPSSSLIQTFYGQHRICYLILSLSFHGTLAGFLVNCSLIV